MLNAHLRQAVASAAGIARAESLHLVQVSSSGATGACILHAWLDGELHPRVVVKTPRDARLHHSLRREWEAVRTLREDPALARLIPAALETFKLDGAEFFVYEGAQGRTLYSRYRNRILWSRAAMLRRFARQALEALIGIHATSTRAASGEEVALDLQGDLAWLERTLDELPRGVSSMASVMAERLARSRDLLPVGRVHGDFSPYNVLSSSMGVDARVALIDWEHSEPERPQHLDLFRFIGACALMGLRGGSRLSSFEAMRTRDGRLANDFLRPWFERMSAQCAAAWLQPPMLDALWWHYWIHAARREQERRASPEDFAGATYLPALARLAQRPLPDWHCRSGAFAT
jgi:hypothetical protein